MSNSIKIDIWSDIGCPWCYIGKRKFEDGAARFHEGASSLPLEIEFHSFELHPDTPLDFEGNEFDYLTSHKGMRAEQLSVMFERAAGIAASAGLVYDYDNLKHINSVKAHQLVHYAKARGSQRAAMDLVLKAYFVDGRMVEYVSDLADLGQELGFDRDDVVRSLDADEYLSEVRSDIHRAASLGITGVPFFVIDGKYGLSGAQDASTFANALEQAASERRAAVDDI